MVLRPSLMSVDTLGNGKLNQMNILKLAILKLIQNLSLI